MPNLGWLQKWTELVSSATTVSELCKKLVHSGVNTGQGIGSYLYLLDNKGQIVQLGGYGVNPLPADQVFSTWEDNLLAKAINTNGLAHQEAEHQGSKLHLYAIPMLKGDTPLGSAMFCQREKMAEFPKEANLAMGQVLGLWLSSTGLVNGFSANGKNGDASPDALTNRQLKILEAMSFGKTNAEIAQDMILSESSIRQETVKIYRALGVSSRNEAVKRALHLGILRAQVS
jgi:DNA-binding CsgD family transcriptional regulator